MSAPILLNRLNILRHLGGDQSIGLEIFETLVSTNDAFIGKPREHEFEFCLAEHQSQGRGRFDKVWQTPFAKNILLSCRWAMPAQIMDYRSLGPVVALAVLSALRSLKFPECACKWPNDILYQQQKLGGILIELHPQKNGEKEVVIGLGLNVNMTESEGDSIQRDWISLSRILGRDIDRNPLVAAIINELRWYLQQWSVVGFSEFLPEWRQYDALQGLKITLQLPHTESDRLEGVYLGITDLGELMLQLSSGEVRRFSSGEACLLRPSRPSPLA